MSGWWLWRNVVRLTSNATYSFVTCCENVCECFVRLICNELITYKTRILYYHNIAVTYMKRGIEEDTKLSRVSFLTPNLFSDK